MPTIHDIADYAGVSKSTVSRVLSDHGYVRESTRKRVKKAIDDLDYTPNYIARGMRTNKSSTIGLFLPDVSNPFYSELFKGMENITRGAGYTTLVCHTAMDPEAEIYYIGELLKRQIDGMIICTYHNDPKNLEYFKELALKKPVIFMDPVFDDERFSYVVSDGYSGVKNAVTWLADRGCSRIANIRGPRARAVTRERHRGYLDGIREAGLEVDTRYVFHGDYSAQSGAEAVRHYLTLPDMPDAIVAVTDVMAIGAVKELLKNSVDVPGQVQVVGFDDIPVADLTQPSLTTVAQPIRELGENAAELLLKQIQNPGTASQQIVMQCTLIERETTR